MDYKEKYQFDYINPKKEQKQRVYNKIKEFILYSALLIGAGYCVNQCMESETMQNIREHTKSIDSTLMKEEQKIYGK